VNTWKFLYTNRALAALAAAGVLTALFFASVTAAHATPVSRANAVRTAKDYLRYQAFSFKGLVGQLKYEGYSTGDARYGASHAGANWMKQAVKAAKDYLRSQAFSRSGLIGQLEYDGFTPAQARHGALAVGL
jgi:host cell surface-exposed lipoprotein